MDLEVRHLQLVAAVAEVGSLTRAGDRLHLTQSALSHQLRDIESRLGAALFLARRQAPRADAGRRASARFGHRRPRAAQADRARHPRDGSRRAGVLRITTECYTCYHWLPPLLLRYRRTFPRVEVRIDVEATRNPIEMLLAGKIDLALISSPVHDRRLVSRRVFDDELVLIASKRHRFAQQAHVAWREMRDETLFVYPPQGRERAAAGRAAAGRCGAGACRGSAVDRGDHRAGEGGAGRRGPRALGGAAARRRRRASSRARSPRAACTATGAR